MSQHSDVTGRFNKELPQTVRTADNNAVGWVLHNEQGIRSPPRKLSKFSKSLRRCPEPCTRTFLAAASISLLHGMSAVPVHSVTAHVSKLKTLIAIWQVLPATGVLLLLSIVLRATHVFSWPASSAL